MRGKKGKSEARKIKYKEEKRSPPLGANSANSPQNRRFPFLDFGVDSLLHFFSPTTGFFALFFLIVESPGLKLSGRSRYL